MLTYEDKKNAVCSKHTNLCSTELLSLRHVGTDMTPKRSEVLKEQLSELFRGLIRK